METLSSNYSAINLSIDTLEDFNLFITILDKMDKPFLDYSWKEIVGLYEDIQDA